MKNSVELIRPHVDSFSISLRNFSRLQETLQTLQTPENQGKIVDTFFQYRLLLKALVRLSEKDRAIISKVNEDRSYKGASALLSELGDQKRVELIASLNKMLNSEEPLYLAALAELTEMMNNGQEIFDEGKTPQDGDQKSDAAIWGFTQIAPEHVNTQLHFLVCHFIERFMTQIYRDAGIEISQHKDYFLTAMTDVLILEYKKNSRFAEIFSLWMKPKSDGGLGWITDGRLDAYNIVLTE